MDPPLGLQMQSLGRELNTVLARFHAVSRHAPSLAAAPDGSLEAVPCSVIDSWEVQLQKRLDACELDKQAALQAAATAAAAAMEAALAAAKAEAERARAVAVSEARQEMQAQSGTALETAHKSASDVQAAAERHLAVLDATAAEVQRCGEVERLAGSSRLSCFSSGRFEIRSVSQRSIQLINISPSSFLRIGIESIVELNSIQLGKVLF